MERVPTLLKKLQKQFEENQSAQAMLTTVQFLHAELISQYDKKTAPKKGNAKADFIFEPGKEVLLQELMPKILNTQLYKAILDANASEHGARMTAMDKATDNAQELLKSLKISYNRARQAAITTELTEIVSGAAALQS